MLTNFIQNPWVAKKRCRIIFTLKFAVETWILMQPNPGIVRVCRMFYAAFSTKFFCCVSDKKLKKKSETHQTYGRAHWQPWYSRLNVSSISYSHIRIRIHIFIILRALFHGWKLRSGCALYLYIFNMQMLIVELFCYVGYACSVKCTLERDRHCCVVVCLSGS